MRMKLVTTSCPEPVIAHIKAGLIEFLLKNGMYSSLCAVHVLASLSTILWAWLWYYFLQALLTWHVWGWVCPHHW